tara:strand:+ start:228 stop:464 length:237 start_codon:yes stop_codon:yes gene_type:complete
MMKKAELTVPVRVSYLAANSGVFNASDIPRDVTIIEVISEWVAKSNGKVTVRVMIVDHDDGDKQKERNFTKSRITVTS